MLLKNPNQVRIITPVIRKSFESWRSCFALWSRNIFYQVDPYSQCVERESNQAKEHLSGSASGRVAAKKPLKISGFKISGLNEQKVEPGVGVIRKNYTFKTIIKTRKTTSKYL